MSSSVCVLAVYGELSICRGGLFRSHNGKSQDTWNPCKLYKGMCRNTCREHEIEYFYCPNDQKCCLKHSKKKKSSNTVKEECSSKCKTHTTDTSSSSQT
uniref:Beta-defensin n=1 Tax=Castor canadensis TaxID=51338 RepID=A0A8C0WYX5_CASCN